MLCCTHADKMPLQRSHHEKQRFAWPTVGLTLPAPPLQQLHCPAPAHRLAAWSLGHAARQRTGGSWPAWPSGACSVSTAAPWRPARMGAGLHQKVRQLPQALPRETQCDPRFLPATRRLQLQSVIVRLRHAPRAVYLRTAATAISDHLNPHRLGALNIHPVSPVDSHCVGPLGSHPLSPWSANLRQPPNLLSTLSASRPIYMLPKPSPNPRCGPPHDAPSPLHLAACAC